MRVDAYNQVAHLYGVQQTTKVQKTNGTGRTSDQVSISQAGRDYQVAKKAVSEASDIREDKVAQLKNMVESASIRSAEMISPADYWRNITYYSIKERQTKVALK